MMIGLMSTLHPHGQDDCLPGRFPVAVAIGLFDGVHCGHQAVLQRTLALAHQHQLQPAVLSFANSPKAVLSPHQFESALLSPAMEKKALLKQMGFTTVWTPWFDTQFAQQTPAAFETWLVHTLQARQVVVGPDFRYGHRAAGTLATLTAAGQRLGLTVHSLPEGFVTQPSTNTTSPEKVGSTRLKQALARGDLAYVTAGLGRPYTLVGRVVPGKQRGKALLETPTANLALPADKLWPAHGVYAGCVLLNAVRYAAVANIGLAPTFGDLLEPVVELHLLDYDGPPFYNQVVAFGLVARLRTEQAFDSLDALRQQIQMDVAKARHLIAAEDWSAWENWYPCPTICLGQSL